MHKFLKNHQKHARQKNYFIGTHTAVRRVYVDSSDYEDNINPITGERIYFDDDTGYIDYRHSIIFSTMDSYADKLEEQFASKHYGKVDIIVSGDIKNLSKQDEWLIEQNELGFNNWYRTLEVTPLRAEGSIINYRLELVPIQGDKKGEEDF